MFKSAEPPRSGSKDAAKHNVKSKASILKQRVDPDIKSKTNGNNSTKSDKSENHAESMATKVVVSIADGGQKGEDTIEKR